VLLFLFVLSFFLTPLYAFCLFFSDRNLKKVYYKSWDWRLGGVFQRLCYTFFFFVFSYHKTHVFHDYFSLLLLTDNVILVEFSHSYSLALF
jgi:hypothetical protein